MWIYQEPATRFFSSDQKRQVAALFDAILPGGDTHPGAADADAAGYLDRLLAMDAGTYYEIPGWRTLYAAALPALDAAAQAAHSRGLAALSRAEVTDLLKSLEKGSLAGLPAGVDAKKLFATLRNHCIEGCFADPRWGGNKDNVIWRWYGYLETSKDFERAGGDA